jgi:hypothetical protein
MSHSTLTTVQQAYRHATTQPDGEVYLRDIPKLGPSGLVSVAGAALWFGLAGVYLAQVPQIGVTSAGLVALAVGLGLMLLHSADRDLRRIDRQAATTDGGDA